MNEICTRTKTKLLGYLWTLSTQKRSGIRENVGYLKWSNSNNSFEINLMWCRERCVGPNIENQTNWMTHFTNIVRTIWCQNNFEILSAIWNAETSKMFHVLRIGCHIHLAFSDFDFVSTRGRTQTRVISILLRFGRLKYTALFSIDLIMFARLLGAFNAAAPKQKYLV